MSAAHAARAARKVCTLVLLTRRGRVLLGMKKRGFGEGKWNGFGGKVEAGETVAAGAARELREECGVVARDLERRGVIWFDWPANERAEEGAHTMLKTGVEVHVFCSASDDVEGEPAETEEMRPRWFDIADIPYDTMWPDDRFWFPHLFAGRAFAAYFLFSGEDKFLENHIRTVADRAELDDPALAREHLLRAVETAHSS